MKTDSREMKHVGPVAPLFGVLTRAGTFPVRDEEVTGFVVETTRENLALVPRLPMYERVAIVDADLVERVHLALAKVKTLLCDKDEIEIAAELIDLIKATAPNTKVCGERSSPAPDHNAGSARSQ